MNDTGKPQLLRTCEVFRFTRTRYSTAIIAIIMTLYVVWWLPSYVQARTKRQNDGCAAQTNPTPDLTLKPYP